MYGRATRLLRRERSYPPKKRELSYRSVDRRFPPRVTSGPAPATLIKMGTAAVRPDETFVTRTSPSYTPRPASDGTVTETGTSTIAPGGSVNAEGGGETHAQS